MNIKKLLSSNLINKAELSKLMWPDNKDPVTRLNKKLNNKNGQRMTDNDYKNAIRVIEFISQ